MDERPVFEKDRACAEALYLFIFIINDIYIFKSSYRGGIDEENNERQRQVEADRKRINDSFECENLI